MDYNELASELFDIRTQMPQTRIERNTSDMGRGEMVVMNYLLSKGNSAHPKDISKATMLTTARIAAILKSLEKQGFITRTPDPMDSRQIIVTLTEPCIRHVEERKKDVIFRTAKMLESLGEEDAKAYVRIQKKLLEMEEIWR